MSINSGSSETQALTAPYLYAASILFSCFLTDLEESVVFITRPWEQDLLVPRIPGVYLN